MAQPDAGDAAGGADDQRGGVGGQRHGQGQNARRAGDGALGRGPEPVGADVPLHQARASLVGHRAHVVEGLDVPTHGLGGRPYVLPRGGQRSRQPGARAPGRLASRWSARWWRPPRAWRRPSRSQSRHQWVRRTACRSEAARTSGSCAGPSVCAARSASRRCWIWPWPSLSAASEYRAGACPQPAMGLTSGRARRISIVHDAAPTGQAVAVWQAERG